MGKKSDKYKGLYDDYFVSKYSEKKEIQELRALFGMPPIDERVYPCKRCKQDFVGEYKNGRKLIWHCYRCKMAVDRNLSAERFEDTPSSIEADFRGDEYTP